MSITEAWLQDVCESVSVPAVAPSVSRKVLPVVEMQVKKLIQQAAKFQKRGKGRAMTVDDVNLALALNGLEEIYGLCPPLDTVGTTTSTSSSSSSSSASSSSTAGPVDLLDFAKQPVPPCPLIPEICLHWLVVDGSQPLIPENPLLVASGAGDGGGKAKDSSAAKPAASSSSSSSAVAVPGDANAHFSLPKEMQHFFSRTTGLMLAGDRHALPAVLEALRSDMGLQDLVPYYSRFIYQQVKANTKSLPMLKVLVSAAGALIANKELHLQFHVQQLLPAIFTCIVAARLSTSPADNHWPLRSMAAEVVAHACRKYSELCPELHARVCKTYLDTVMAALAALPADADAAVTAADAASQQQGDNQRAAALATLYGGLVGLSALGQAVIRSLVLPHVSQVMQALDAVLAVGRRFRVLQQPSSSTAAHVEQTYAAEMCRSALLRALGTYMVERNRCFGDLAWGGSIGAGGGSSQHMPSQPADVAGLAEPMIPYYGSFSKELFYGRLFL